MEPRSSRRAGEAVQGQRRRAPRPRHSCSGGPRSPESPPPHRGQASVRAAGAEQRWRPVVPGAPGQGAGRCPDCSSQAAGEGRGQGPL